MAKLISKTYADALFEIALSENKIDLFEEEANAVRQILSDNRDFGKLISNPRISPEDKQAMVENVFKDRISDELTGFFSVIVAKGRFSQIDEILEYFGNEIKKHKGIGVAFVATPFELTEAQKAKVEQRILDTTDFTKMEMHYSLDKELIGGMQIRIGDCVVDSSINTKVVRLQHELMNLQIG